MGKLMSEVNDILDKKDVKATFFVLGSNVDLNPEITKRAYEELERDGFIESYTGKGSFIKAQNKELFREEQLRQIEDMLINVCDKAKLCGVELDELREILEIVYGGQL